jgi:hypothetical protein
LGEAQVSSLPHRSASLKPCVATLSSSPDDKPPESQLLGDVLPGARCVCMALRTLHGRVFSISIAFSGVFLKRTVLIFHHDCAFC